MTRKAANAGLMALLLSTALGGWIDQPAHATTSPAAAADAPTGAESGQGHSASHSAEVHPELWPAVAWPRVIDEAGEARVQALLGRMGLACKVGQILQGDIGTVTPQDIRTYHLGSVLNGGNSGPGGDDLAGPAQWLALADAYYEASITPSADCPPIPVMWGTDAVHGHSNIVGATLFPHNVGLGAARDPDLIERIGAATAAEIRVTGQEWTFAPTVTVPQDYRWGRAYEGYSSDPALVASYVGRMVRGLQGPPSTAPILAGPHVIASTKHFLADGGTHDGIDQGDARIGETELRLIHGAPYLPAIENGVATVMTSFSSWQGVKIAGHRGLVTDLLKGRMNFGGLVVTDWNAHGQVAGCSNASCPATVNAGLDMLMAPDSWKLLYASLLGQVRDGTIPMARLDDAVARVLRVKQRLGLFDAGKPSTRLLAGRYELLGSAEHRAIAREAVRKSLVLLKNDGVLPLRPAARILVAGDGADDIARQAGGWTLSWQGTGLTNAQFPGATSLWGGIAAAARSGGGSAELAPDGQFRTRPDAAVVVFGETPYAEFQGDLTSLQLKPELRGPLATMHRLRAQGIPVVAVMLTGRPLFVNPELNAANAFITAWLPGSEGGGVADLLFARNGEDFRGRLPMVWPAEARPGAKPLFPFGYGLTLADGPQGWTVLPEDSGVAEEGSAGVYLAKGQPTAAWSLEVDRAGGGESLRVTKVPALALGGRVQIAAVDHLVQEGARQFRLRANPSGTTIRLTTTSPIDIGRQSNGELMLLATLRIDSPPSGPVSLTQSCGDRCAATIPLPELKSLPAGTWTVLGVPLKCFARAGADMGRITSPWALTTRGSLTFSLAQVSLGTLADRVAACPR
ncbi:exo 1,3/1,4-beta-D-glucan glucohydrolase [Novosphingobium flavum]|uniref:Exo 1,3/1,4-beta-D-glucan glucohydrolase n=1 Tax=Novosphingobium aerophilum TaxID=2839843 RepID=A0A7X1KAL7_9SPHN|nr:glycoside hydrolase family 3 protein [Novosphingobium aerophilum]MBC2650331.1 exo 1,3/1,4-beta-D-glucan glucohydrolase [Novosphingobium aerophilum]MBC2660292.1 exo 1,3/1,4-beta-D-glucan glucohydrolase [Novosphingobium aerophilum]